MLQIPEINWPILIHYYNIMFFFFILHCIVLLFIYYFFCSSIQLWYILQDLTTNKPSYRTASLSSKPHASPPLRQYCCRGSSSLPDCSKPRREAPRASAPSQEVREAQQFLPVMDGWSKYVKICRSNGWPGSNFDILTCLTVWHFFCH